MLVCGVLNLEFEIIEEKYSQIVKKQKQQKKQDFLPLHALKESSCLCMPWNTLWQ